jgi:hypothetical protein
VSRSTMAEQSRGSVKVRVQPAKLDLHQLRHHPPRRS